MSENDPVHVTLKLSAEEKRIILLWYDYFRADSQHYGDGLATFPQEQIVLRKLEQAGTDDITFSIYDIETVKSWMDKSVKGKFGGDIYLTGEEGMVYDKITHLYRECFPEQVAPPNSEGGKTGYSLDPGWKARITSDKPGESDEGKPAGKESPKKKSSGKARSFDDKLSNIRNFKKDLKGLEDKFKDFQRGKKTK